MLVTRKRVVEEEVTKVISYTNSHYYTRRARMKDEHNRQESFAWLVNQGVLDDCSMQNLAKAGFYFSSTAISATECFACGLGKPLGFWLDGNDPATVHRKEGPNCKYINGHCDNAPADSEKGNFGKRFNETESLTSHESVIEEFQKTRTEEG